MHIVAYTYIYTYVMHKCMYTHTVICMTFAVDR